MTSNKAQRLTLYMFFFSINFEIWDPFNTGGFFSVSKLTGIIYFLTLVPNISFFFNKNKIGKFLNPLWIFFLLLTIVGLINIDVRNIAFFNFTFFLNIIIFWILIKHERKDAKILEKGLLAFALGSFALAMCYQAGLGVEVNSDGRTVMFGDNENSVGLRMAISILVISLFVIQNVFKLGVFRYLLLLLIPVMLDLLFNTGSRVALLCVVLVLLLGTLLIKYTKIRYKIYTIFTALGFGILGTNYFLKSEVMSGRILKSVEDRDLAGRDDIWNDLMPFLESNIIFGKGQTGYEQFCQIKFGSFISPHNVFIEVVAYTGIIGLLIFLYFGRNILITSFVYYRKSGYLLPLLLMIPIFGVMLSGQLFEVKLMWIIFAYLASKHQYI